MLYLDAARWGLSLRIHARQRAEGPRIKFSGVIQFRQGYGIASG